MTSKEKEIIPVVQEFYTSLRDQEARRPYEAIWETILVRGKEVPVTPRYAEMYKWPEGWDLLSPPSDNTMQIDEEEERSEDEEEKEEKATEQDFQEEDNNYEATFQPQHST
ncbi:hypothetical protein Gotri_006836 [Gossypium trilobum]|uniref:Uncharacterized protein n=1 Tax=Gossypium trilobum TaxID=34281 RepID=A0A7J9FPF5_9ROSI|nr:hypothetical protein [Gossypium trilobum]